MLFRSGPGVGGRDRYKERDSTKGETRRESEVAAGRGPGGPPSAPPSAGGSRGPLEGQRARDDVGPVAVVLCLLLRGGEATVDLEIL